MIYADLLRELASVQQDEIPAALGALAEAQAILQARLLVVPALPAVEPDRLLTAEDVAARLAVKEDYVYRHADRWSFTCRRVGKLLRFSERGLDEWLANGTP